jgi:hypothetical protein
MKKAAWLGITVLILAALTVSITGCAPEKVAAPFQPREVKPEHYTPEPEWNPNTDPFLLRIQRLKVRAGVPISAAGIPEAAVPGAPGAPSVPGAPGLAPPAPPPPPRTPLRTDAVYGVARDRVEGGIIPGAVVKLHNRRGTQIDQFTTNAYGEYSFVNLSPGYYYVVASATGYTATPLSTYNFYYLSGTIVANLELAYSAPYQQIEGGDFLSSTGDVMKVAMYVSAAQIVYNAALFEVRSTEGEVYYTFTVPAPNLNKYSYDNQKVSFPTPFSWHSATKAWTGGGTFQVLYYDWYLRGWYQYPDPPNLDYWDTGTYASKNLIFSAIHPTTGRVSIRVKGYPSSHPRLLLTYAKLDYDYHKDTTAPVLSSPSVAKVGANATISYRVSEDAFVTITLTGPTPSTRSVVNLAGVKAETFAGLANGSYQYTIQATDGAGNVSATLGPYSFTMP